MKYLKKTPLIISFLSFITFITSVNADVKVVASIKPIHSLASYLMDGVGKPDLIVDLIAEDTVDEKIVKALRRKINIASEVMGEELRAWI